MLHSLIKTIFLFSLAIALAGCSSLSTKTAGIRVESAGKSHARQIQIRIAKDGALNVDGEPCDIEALGERATELSATAVGSSEAVEELQFSVASEAGADNALLVSVMYELAQVGITNVNVIADF